VLWPDGRGLMSCNRPCGRTGHRGFWRLRGPLCLRSVGRPWAYAVEFAATHETKPAIVQVRARLASEQSEDPLLYPRPNCEPDNASSLSVAPGERLSARSEVAIGPRLARKSVFRWLNDCQRDR
jgi:hypothetical protein